jgi:hypothetical protein
VPWNHVVAYLKAADLTDLSQNGHILVKFTPLKWILRSASANVLSVAEIESTHQDRRCRVKNQCTIAGD